MTWIWSSGEELLLWLIAIAGLAVGLVAIVLMGMVMFNMVRSAIAQVRESFRASRSRDTVPAPREQQADGRSAREEVPPGDRRAQPSTPALERRAERRSPVRRLGLDALKPGPAQTATWHTETAPTGPRSSPGSLAGSGSPHRDQAVSSRAAPGAPATPRAAALFEAEEPTRHDSPVQPPSLGDHLAGTEREATASGRKRLQDQIGGLQKALDQLESLADATRALERDVAAFRQFASVLEARLQALEAFEHRLDALETAASRLDDLELRQRQALDALGARLSALEASRQAIDAVEDRVDTHQDRIAALERTAAGLANLETAVEDAVEVGRKLPEFERRVAGVAAECDSLKQHIQPLSGLRRELESVQQAAKDLQGMHAAHRHTMDGLQSEVRAQQQRLTRLRSTVESLSAQQRALEEGIEGIVSDDDLVRAPVPAEDPDWLRVAALLQPLRAGANAAGAGRLERILHGAGRLEAEARTFIRVAQCLTGRIDPPEASFATVCRAAGPDHASVIRAEKTLKSILFGYLAALSRMRIHLSHGSSGSTPLGLLEAEAFTRLVRPLAGTGTTREAAPRPGRNGAAGGTNGDTPAPALLEDAVAQAFREIDVSRETGKCNRPDNALLHGPRPNGSAALPGPPILPEDSILDIEHLVQAILRRVIIPFLSKVLYLVYACPVERLSDIESGHAAGARLVEVLAGDVDRPETLTVTSSHFGSSVTDLLSAMGWGAVTVIPYLHTLDHVRAWTDAVLVEPRVYFKPLEALLHRPVEDRHAFAARVARVDVPLLHSEDRSRATSPKYGIVQV